MLWTLSPLIQRVALNAPQHILPTAVKQNKRNCYLALQINASPSSHGLELFNRNLLNLTTNWMCSVCWSWQAQTGVINAGHTAKSRATNAHRLPTISMACLVFELFPSSWLSSSIAAALHNLTALCFSVGQVHAISESNRFEAEIRQEQDAKKKQAEEQKQRRAAFNDLKSAFKWMLYSSQHLLLCVCVCVCVCVCGCVWVRVCV